jgi:ATP-dependent Clp protease protease subunit
MFSFLNCSGGSIIPGVGLFDIMQIIVPDVHTICMGITTSMRSFILIMGEITKRIELPHSRVMIHQPISSYYDGPTIDFHTKSKHVMMLHDYITKCYIERMGNPREVILRDLDKDVFMSTTKS